MTALESHQLQLSSSVPLEPHSSTVEPPHQSTSSVFLPSLSPSPGPHLCFLGPPPRYSTRTQAFVSGSLLEEPKVRHSPGAQDFSFSVIQMVRLNSLAAADTQGDSVLLQSAFSHNSCSLPERDSVPAFRKIFFLSRLCFCLAHSVLCAWLFHVYFLCEDHVFQVNRLTTGHSS